MANVTVYVVTNWQNLPAQVTPIDATNLNHLENGVKALNDFINTLHAESGLYLCATPFLAADRTKLDGIEAKANKYVLPAATTGSLGGVKVDGVTILIDENGVISSSASGSQTLAGLTDVDLAQLADGQILKYDAQNSKWVNATNEAVTTLANLTDTEITNPSDGQVLKYDAESGKWINGTGGGGGSATLAGLDDVDLDTPASGQILRFNGDDWENSDEDILNYANTMSELGEPGSSYIDEVRLKSFTYTGNGNINNEITFPKTPQMIFSITSDNANNFKVNVVPFVWGAPITWNYWWLTNQKQGTSISLSYSGNVLTLTGADVGQSCNINGATYTVYYI